MFVFFLPVNEHTSPGNRTLFLFVFSHAPLKNGDECTTNRNRQNEQNDFSCTQQHPKIITKKRKKDGAAENDQG